MKIVLASANQGKLRELQSLLQPLGHELVSQTNLEIHPAPETGLTFVENALDKARHASRESGLPAIADDSGIVVRALGGAPGIYSARYAGPAADDDANNAKLVCALREYNDHHAHYYCAIVYLRHPEDPAPLLATGRWEGEILQVPRGSGGFGYDPYFLVAGDNRTAAEMPAAEKNQLSHRAQAVGLLCQQLDQP